jgi:hypothetical protein
LYSCYTKALNDKERQIIKDKFSAVNAVGLYKLNPVDP